MYLDVLSISNFVYLFSALIILLGIVIKHKNFQKLGKIVFVIGFLVELAYFVLRTIETYQKGYDYFPVANAFESFVFFTLCVGILQIIFIKKTSAFFVMFSAIIISATLLFLSISGFSEHIEPLIPALQSNWLTAHVVTSFLAYAGFTINFIASSYILYSSKNYLDKSIGALSFSSLLALIVSVIISKLSHNNIFVVFGAFWVILAAILFVVSFILNPFTNKEWLEKPLIFGFVLLTIGIITGSIWAKYAWGGYWSWDPKETWSFITWIVYLINLHFIRKHKSARFLACMGVLGFVCVLITYLGVNFILPGLHSYGSQ